MVSSWMPEKTFAAAEKMETSRNPQRPKMVMIRNNSESSSRSAQSQDAWLEKSTIPPAAERSFLNNDDSTSYVNGFAPPPSNWPFQQSQSNSGSNTRASSPIVPVVRSLQDTESRGTRDQTFTSSSSSELDRTPQPHYFPTLERPPLQPGPNLSRFSWTETFSQEPPTPRFALGRQSIATSSRSSLPRHRTVNSWVDNQTGRLDSALFHQQSDLPHSVFESSEDGSSQVSGPTLPRASPQQPWAATGPKDEISPEPESNPFNDIEGVQERTFGGAQQQPVSAIQHLERQREDVRQHVRKKTESSEQSIFRYHPGEELRMPRGRVIKSEELNQKLPPPGSF
jgi:hypothetical protein